MDKKSGFDFHRSYNLFITMLAGCFRSTGKQKQPTVWIFEILSTYPVAKPPSMVDENL
jgi:hypothetical protein